jgi:hypothetical protein
VSDSDDFIERASEMIKDMGLMLCNHLVGIDPTRW